MDPGERRDCTTGRCKLQQQPCHPGSAAEAAAAAAAAAPAHQHAVVTYRNFVPYLCSLYDAALANDDATANDALDKRRAGGGPAASRTRAIPARELVCTHADTQAKTRMHACMHAFLHSCITAHAYTCTYTQGAITTQHMADAPGHARASRQEATEQSRRIHRQLLVRRPNNRVVAHNAISANVDGSEIAPDDRAVPNDNLRHTYEPCLFNQSRPSVKLCTPTRDAPCRAA